MQDLDNVLNRIRKLSKCAVLFPEEQLPLLLIITAVIFRPVWVRLNYDVLINVKHLDISRHLGSLRHKLNTLHNECIDTVTHSK